MFFQQADDGRLTLGGVAFQDGLVVGIFCRVAVRNAVLGLRRFRGLHEVVVCFAILLALWT
eukprot:3056108-Pyramimonas_sp.AAC.1